MSDAGDGNDPGPTIKSKDVLRDLARVVPGKYEVSDAEKRYIRHTRKTNIAAQEQYEHLQGTKDHYKHKGMWSWFLMAAIGGMVVFQSALLVLVGAGVLDFSQYDWLLPALLVQNLGQVVGLAVYAVRFLFSDIRGNSDEK